MRLSAGSQVVVAVIFLGLGVVAGGRVWTYTDSEVLGWAAGLIPVGVAGLGWRASARRAAAATDVSFPGESQVGLDESEFSEIEETDVLTGRLRSRRYRAISAEGSGFDSIDVGR